MNRKLLEEPFPDEIIRTRPGRFGEEICYVEAAHFIQRLNDAFDGRWSFEIQDQKILENEVLVLGKLSTDNIMKMAFGGSEITRARNTGEILSIADDIKAAATDSLKKACSLLGMGLYLYADNGNAKDVSDDAVNPAEQGAIPAENGNGNGDTEESCGNGNSITRKQLDFMQIIAREKGLSKKSLTDMSVKQFKKQPEKLSKTEASRLIEYLRKVKISQKPGKEGNNGTSITA
jgi:hypothetical protein